MGRPSAADVVGLLPAAGHARRLGALPCSKEVLPVGFTADGRPIVACEPLLDRLARGGVSRALVLLRHGKGDVAAYLGSGERYGIDLAYRFLEPTPSVPATLAAAAPFVAGCRVALGFPDILFEPADAFARLLARQEATAADLVLGLFPVDAARAPTTDMVETDAAGRLVALHVKQPDRGLRHNWAIAVWTPRFTDLLVAAAARPPGERELQVGDVVAEALRAGWPVETVAFPDGSYLDVGTPGDLRRALAGP